MSKEFHGFNQHDFHIKRYNFCLYCANGSKPVHESLLKVGD